MNKKSRFNDLLNNDKVVLILSFFIAVCIWLAVVINVSEETTRIIKDVKVVIDNTVPSQFGLEVFGDSDFTVDVTVTGKKYQISDAALSADDILVTAQTSNVDSVGTRTLQLKAEDAKGRTSYKISSTSLKTVDVYFDKAKTVQLVVEPELVADGFDIVDEGFTCGTINLSETSVTVSGPSAEVNRIKKVVARLPLEAPLSSNKSADAPLILIGENDETNFKYTTLSVDNVVLTIPVLRVKEVKTSVTFKNAPDNYVVSPLPFTVSPASDEFNISVDEYDKTEEYPVGNVDFRFLSPSNHVFTFEAADIGAAASDETQSYNVTVNMSGIEQEYFSIGTDKIKVTEPEGAKLKVSELNKSVVIVGTPKDLAAVTEDMISVAVDASALKINEGQTLSVPAAVTIKDAPGCWVYGNYSVEVSL